MLTKLTYETGTATFIQFITLGLLNIANGLNSIVTTCRQDSGNDCIGNTLVSIIFFILTTLWFGCLWVLGYIAQERRSKFLAKVLILAELLVMMVAYFNATHHTDVLGLTTSIIDLGLAAWIIYLSFRLMRAGGGRVVSHSRGRVRKRPLPPES